MAAWKAALAKPISTDAILTRSAGPEQSAQILASVRAEESSAAKAAEAALLPDSDLTTKQEAQLRHLIDLLSSDDLSSDGTPIRRVARDELSQWLAGLSPGQQATTVERLLNQLSRKSYRFQLGVAQAIGEQRHPLSVFDRDAAQAEITAAQKAKAGQETALKRQLENAMTALKSARELKPS
jgi:hypothetical protein